MQFDYDLFVIGAGPGGLAASERAASYGAKVAIAEHDRVGGTCVIHGCIPEKLMVYAASFSQNYETAEAYGWGKVQDNFDWSKFQAAKDRDIEHLSEVHTQKLQKSGVELIKGHARFLDAHTLEVEGRKITADKVLIAVGGKAVKPDIPGIEYAITSREMFSLDQQPQRLAVIGSNQIPVKFAGIMNSLGSKVIQIVAEDEVLPTFDQDIRTTVQTDMVEQGIQILCQTRVEKIEKETAGFKLTLSGNNVPLIVDSIVWMTDRVPNTEGLALEKAGVNLTPRGTIQVDEQSRTTQTNVFAIGDCTDRPHWTPVATATGRAFADTEFGNHPHIISYDYIPVTVASYPEAATVGLSEAQARQKLGDSVRCYRKSFESLFYSLTQPEEKTLLKLVVDTHSDRIVGAHMVGQYASEIVQMMTPALKMGVTKASFDQSIGIHPSVAEEFFSLR
ncbi:glutathione reductase (plasmid) [Leptolyngbya sp. NIES-3755]|nr:glutathione reductase [Leptolyngbya sp. NIES-3755]